MIAMMECQSNYIVSFIKQMRRPRLAAAVATLKPEMEEAFVREMARRLGRSVWQAGSCDSYYMTAAAAGAGGGKAAAEGGKGKGKAPAVANTKPASDLTWPGSVVEYWRRTRRADLRRQWDVVVDGRTTAR